MKIAVLGCGSIGTRHLKNLQAMGHEPLIAFDASPEARTRLHAETGVFCAATLEDVWRAKPEVVLVTTPPEQHVPLALEAALRGCHLFIEKPVSNTLSGLEELHAEVIRRRLVVMVACNMRFHPGPAAIKQLLSERVAGEVLSARICCGSYLPRWRPQQDYRRSYSASTGALLDCIHELDLALWYLGPARLLAAAWRRADSLGLECDGLYELLLRHEGGPLSSVHVNFVQRDYRRTCQIVGTKGTLSWDFEQAEVVAHGEDGRVQRRIAEPAGWEINRMYIEQMQHFIRCVETGTAPANGLQGGAAALSLALEARKRGVEA